ncbi:DUF4440 domain-containing protein [Streptomyces sp. NPDC005209]|uniref:DUF4440 domain-containing protein n=1 Tax=Streptomyces sp. NPDC005209 TaxID=3156715 RepID=UPI0033B0906A
MPPVSRDADEAIAGELRLMDPAVRASWKEGPRSEPSDVTGVVLAPGLVHLTHETAFGGRHTRRGSLWRRRAEGPDGRRLYYHQATPVPGRSA